MNAATVTAGPQTFDPDMALARVRHRLEQMAAERCGHGLDQARRAAAVHLASGGQLLRARLCLETAWRCGLALPQASGMAVACELVHNASLVHDDICDRSAWRRGAPSVRARNGDALALCTGDWLLCAAYAALAEAVPGERGGALIALLSRRAQDTIEGQAAELGAGAGAPPGLAEYARLARAKAGALFSLAVEAPLLAAGLGQAARPARAAAQALALGYQLIDDARDYPAAEDAAAVEGVNAIAVVGGPTPSLSAARRRVRALAAGRIAKAMRLAAALPADLGTPLRRCAGDLASELERGERAS